MVNMEYNKEKVDEMTLALLYLNIFEEHDWKRTWKSYDWDTLDRLYNKGYISNPKSKSKSIVLTEEGAEFSKELFKKHFGK